MRESLKYFCGSKSAAAREGKSGSKSARLRGLALPPDVLTQVHPEGVVLLHIRKGLIFTANAVGARILEGVANNQDLGTIAAQISRAFQASRDQVEEDTADFLATLLDHGLLTNTERC
jgi:hypothetical protein